jgi:hypothetical protein
MEFDKFLNALDESAMLRVSKKQLLEAAGGEDPQGIKDGAEWYYVPKKEFGSFRHIVAQYGADDWAVYYLDQAGAGGDKEDVSGWGDLALSRNEEVQRVGRYLKEGKGEDNGVDLGAYIVSREVKGDFKKVLLECVDIVKKG